jgi:pimeloyl-ACP methyl ester carboxylesterase/DNA-binding CsgD family transcriptional regulator
MGKLESGKTAAATTADYAQEWLAVPELLLDRVRRDPDAVEQHFRALDDAHEYRMHSLLNIDALALMLVDPAARQIVASSGALPADTVGPIDWEMAETVLQGRTMQLAQASEQVGHSFLAYIPAHEAENWDLPEDIHKLLADSPGGRILIAMPSASLERPLRRACAAFGMTGLEIRVVEATLQTGSIRAGADAAALSYATAREAMSAALAKVGVTRMPGLLHRLSLLSLGIFPDGDESIELLTDRWGLKPRQAQIAVLLAQGLTRADTARALGISEATVKKQVDIIFQILGVSSAAALAQSMSMMIAMQALTDASHGRISWIDGNSEPLRFVHRPGGGRIALSDYGPVGGRPVIILHSSMTSRHPPRRLVSALMRNGLRVLAIDRPGFGMTDIESEVTAGDPFAPAAHDMKTVLDRLRIEQVDIIARGGAQVAVAFAGLFPDRCGAVVLVNPDPPSTRDERRWGVLGSFKEAYRQRPELILSAARLIARTMTRNFLARVLRKSMRGSPPDEALLADEQVVDDYYRAVRMFATGRLAGYVREQSALAQGKAGNYPVDGCGWAVLLGEHDTLSDPETTLAYWREQLPAAEFERIPDQGRLLAYAAPELIAERLRDRKQR